jgi:Flp pilus assembly pilin Flp
MGLNQVRRLITGEEAISSVEYAALLSLICTGILAAILGMGDSISTRMDSSAEALRM